MSGYLEMANVELEKEFSEMIIIQRGFPANCKIITITEAKIEKLGNMKRLNRVYRLSVLKVCILEK